MARDLSAYREIAVQSCLVDGQVRLRPLPGQAFATSMPVACARRLCDTGIYPLGTRFLLQAKLTDRLGGPPFLYVYYGDSERVLDDKAAQRFLADFRRRRI